MRFVETKLAGAVVVDPEPILDNRGFFARSFCEREFAAHGLETRFPQHSISYNARKGTLRGMHFQRAPHAETKLVRCSAGAIFDVIVDLRENSPTRGRWEGFELTVGNRRQLYIPQGFGHGFQALCDDAEITYMISAFHEPAAAAGFRYDDPALAIQWPLPVSVIADRDLAWPAFPA
jgi:dTDP-4-dehydrorhamnose 3,5-epimerase